MNRQPTLETERLIIRPLEEADREALYEVASDPAVWEQHPMHDRWRREVFDEFFDQGIASGGALAVIDKRDGSIIGSSRYDRFQPDEGGSVEIGWTFLACRFWGKGVNREMKRVMLEHALSEVEMVEFRVGDTNYRSRQAMENIGGRRSDRYELGRYQGKRVVHLYYEITRDDFSGGPLATG